MDDTLLSTTAAFIGRHNSDLNFSTERLRNARTSEDLSTICIIPNNGLIDAKVAENWLNQMAPMNQKFMRLMMTGMTRYEGYNTAINQILNTPALARHKYILTMEENIIPPPDGLPKLYESIEKYDVVGGLVWTPGVSGKPMVYGFPGAIPLSFTSIYPEPEKVQGCLGLGTGFTLFKIDIFKNPLVPRPWFGATKNDPDMYFFENIHRLGYKVACDTRIRIGTFDNETGIIW